MKAMKGQKTNRWIAVNNYRNSTSSGFSNTWQIYRCTAETRKRLLLTGLPVNDQCYGDGSPCLSTMGIRAVTNAERKTAAREDKLHPGYIKIIE